MATIDLGGPAADTHFGRTQNPGHADAGARLENWFDGWGAFDRSAAMSAPVTELEASRQPLDPRPATDFPAVIDLAMLDGTDGFRIEGTDLFDYARSSVSWAGDFNGDGLDDIIVGAPGGGTGLSGAGESYIVFGKLGGFGESVDLRELDGGNGFRLDGVSNKDESGASVSSAGDVNGDGFDDIIIGAPGARPGERKYAGEAYVAFGGAGGFPAVFDLASLDGGNGFRLDGAGKRDDSGFAVSSAGDVNGDGFDDIIIGAPGAKPGGVYGVGRSYVVFGRADGFAASLDLSALDGGNGFVINGVDQQDYSGFSVSSAGDVNGDGFDDIIIGSGRRFGVAAESYVVFGQAAGFGARLDLASLDGSNGFRLVGVDVGDKTGASVSSAGDVNGDGLDDMIIGAPAADRGGAFYVGESYVVFGRADAFGASLDLATLDGSNGFRLDGIDPFGFSGVSVSSAGDVNGDGFDDIVIGAPTVALSDSYESESYVVFGKAGGFGASIDLSTLDGSNGFLIDGVIERDYSGTSVSAAGDVNGDGFDDIIIGADGPNSGRDFGAGESYVIYGRAPDEAVRRLGSAADQEIRGGDFGDTLAGRGGDDALFGGGGDDRLVGGGGRDTLVGGAGDDQLVMNAGGDRMKGGAGADAFVLTDDLADADRAVITDFASGTNLFAIDADDFGGGLTPGALDPDAFVVNATGMAGDADDRFIYNSAKGLLFYDADGSGAGESVLIAKLKDAPVVTADDFLVI